MRVLQIFFFVLLMASAYCLVPLQKTFAQTAPKDSFYQAAVVSLSPSNKTLKVTLNGKTVQVTYEPQSSGQIHPGDAIIIAKTAKVGSGTSSYYFVDEYRVLPLTLVILGFFGLILLIAGLKGIGSIAGLLISLGVIFLYIIPQILSGADALTICMIGAIGILFVTTFVAHGVSPQTLTALIGTLIALVITYFLAQGISQLVLATGYGNEDAVNLQFALPHMLDLKGLFLGGIILATLGALNDITITQAASIFSIAKIHPASNFQSLIKEGYTIGREHALSLVNTLVLAFAGASLAIFIFVFANPNNQPLWVVLNSEFMIEEMMKIIIGTAGLLLSVPIVTLLGALVNDSEIRKTVKGMFQK